jgi:hypothetical protein
MQFNHHPASLELDTGTFTTLLTKKAAKRLDLHPDVDKSTAC